MMNETWQFTRWTVASAIRMCPALLLLIFIAAVITLSIDGGKSGPNDPTPKTNKDSRSKSPSNNRIVTFRQPEMVDNRSASGDLARLSSKNRESSVRRSATQKREGTYDRSPASALRQLHPGSTEAERIRFLNSRDGNVPAASKKIGAYLEWRELNRLDDDHAVTGPSNSDPSDSDADWTRACHAAMDAEDPARTKPGSRIVLPRIVYVDDVTIGALTSDRLRIVQVLAARVDVKIASADVYALAVAFYLDRKLDRGSVEKVCVMIDARSGRGWANPQVMKIVPFIKSVTGLLGDHFPERMQTCVVFPVPAAAKMVWRLIKPLLDPNTAKKIKIYSGSAHVDSSLPKDQLVKFISEGVLNFLERRRQSTFV